MAGGLTGSNGGTASVTQSYATGNVSATSVSGTALAGGLVASNAGPVTQSYATGAAYAFSASGAASAGGLIGNNGPATPRSPRPIGIRSRPARPSELAPA